MGAVGVGVWGRGLLLMRVVVGGVGVGVGGGRWGGGEGGVEEGVWLRKWRG